jgi:polysaccharide deacetylase family protein (PEP-CTERM system associated)
MPVFEPAPEPTLSSAPAGQVHPHFTTPRGMTRRHILTVVLEDYYHLSPFKGLIDRTRWSRFERRLEIGARRTLTLLDEFDVRATFFVLGWVAEMVPELVRDITDRGHEVASKGYDHRSIQEMSPALFWEDIHRSREALEHATGRQVLGYRIADRWFSPGDLWALDMLRQAGYRYDSSIKPIFRSFRQEPWRRFIHQHNGPAGSIWEVPVSSADIFGYHIPVAGGNYFRQFPRKFVRRAIADWDRHVAAPFVMYFHTWELDPEQPRISAASLAASIRQYRNLRQMEPMLREYLARYSFHGIADHLGIKQLTSRWSPDAIGPSLARHAGPTDQSRRAGVSIVVPCYNEEAALPYLANTLRELEQVLEDYRLEFVFVDDGSRDRTPEMLEQLFGQKADCVIVPCEKNRGVTAAILTGIREATSEIVCSIDCDCSYDPRELRSMIPLLGEGVDLVTASPYHPQGSVRNVPQWRLSLSKSASALYRLLSRHKLGTYTSCFRVYRRRAMLDLDIRQPGFLGIVEIIGKLDLRGRNIAEYPTTLESRILGRSKMKTLRTIAGHLGLMARLAWLRATRRGVPSPLVTFVSRKSPENGSGAIPNP